MELHTTERNGIPEPRNGFCVYISTLCQGDIPSVTNGDGYPFVFPNREAAERDIAELAIDRLQEFLDGLRDFEEAMILDEYVVEVDVHPDGSISDEDGNFFGKNF